MSGFQMTGYISTVQLWDCGDHLVFWSSDNRTGFFQMVVWLKFITKLDHFVYKVINTISFLVKQSSLSCQVFNWPVMLVMFDYWMVLCYQHLVKAKIDHLITRIVWISDVYCAFQNLENQLDIIQKWLIIIGKVSEGNSINLNTYKSFEFQSVLKTRNSNALSS
jgi:hypothetical protein